VKFLVTLLLGAAATIYAQPNLSFKDALDLALRTHPALNAGTARTAVASGNLQQAGLRPNPRLFLQVENLRATGTPSFDFGRDPDMFAYLSNQFEMGGKRDRRVDLATAVLKRSEFERAVLARHIAARVAQAYWSAAGAQTVHELLLDNTSNFQRIITYHEVRVREGAMAEADLLKVRLEGERLALAVNSAALDAERTRIQLFREMGQVEFPVAKLEPISEQIAMPPMAVADPAGAVENRPEVRLARQVLEQARAATQLQRANATPDLEGLFGYKRTAGFNTVIGGLQWNLPVRNRNQGAIAAADAEVRVAESDAAATEALVRAEVQAASTEVRLRREQIMRIFGGPDGQGLRGQAAESARIAEAAYREGGTDLLRLLDAQRVKIELQLLYFKTLAEYRQSIAALNAAAGVNP